MHGELAHLLLILIVAASILLMLLRPWNTPEVYWTGSGAILLVVSGLVPVRLAGRAVLEGLDVYLFLIGMMLLSELARENGVFDWLASAAIRHSRGSTARLFLLTYGIGILVTAWMSNDATAVVLTPAVLASARSARVAPRPFLFACAMIANAASFLLPISNPANLVVFRGGMPRLAEWVAVFLVPSIVSIALTFVVLRWSFRKELSGAIEAAPSNHRLDANGRVVVAGLGLVVVALLIASALNVDLGLPTCIAAIAVTAVVCLRRRQSPLPLLREISWPTLALVAALFVLVDAVTSIGALRVVEEAFRGAAQQGVARAALEIGSIVGVGSNVVNNLPLGLLAGSTLAATHTHGVLADAVLIAVDLGPNLSVTGSLATILWLIALRKEDMHVSFVDFLKIGVLAMPIALLGSIASLVAMAKMLGMQ